MTLTVIPHGGASDTTIAPYRGASNISKYLASAIPVNTALAIRSDWEKFAAYCARSGLSIMPASAETVVGFLSDAADLVSENGAPAYAPSTISRWLSSINRVHREAGEVAPGSDPMVQQVMKGIRRAIPRAPKRALALMLDDLRTTLAAIDRTRSPAGIIGARDYALLLIGWATASRRAELLGLNVDDVSIDARSGLLLNIVRSKTDQDAIGFTKAIQFGRTPATCAPCAFAHWVNLLNASMIGPGAVATQVAGFDPEAHLCEGWANPGTMRGAPLFRGILKNGRIGTTRPSGAAMNAVVERRLRLAGLDPDGFSSHSMRAGFITQAFREGASAHQIMRQTAHRNPATLEIYAREADPLRENAVMKMAL